MKIWSDALLIHRAAENYSGVALMVRDPVLLRLAAAWPHVKRKRTGDLPKHRSQPVEEIIETLWKEIQPDYQGWAALTQLNPVQVMEGFTVLKGAGLILPDGTLNHLADSVLKKEAAGELLAGFGIKPGDLKK